MTWRCGPRGLRRRGRGRGRRFGAFVGGGRWRRRAHRQRGGQCVPAAAAPAAARGENGNAGDQRSALEYLGHGWAARQHAARWVKKVGLQMRRRAPALAVREAVRRVVVVRGGAGPRRAAARQQRALSVLKVDIVDSLFERRVHRVTGVSLDCFCLQRLGSHEFIDVHAAFWPWRQAAVGQNRMFSAWLPVYLCNRPATTRSAGRRRRPNGRPA